MREVISTKDAPQAIGPYSQAIKANGFVFVSGQIAIDPASQQVVTGDVGAQTDRVLRNLSEILEAAESGLGKVVRSTVYLKNMGDFAAMNAVYGKYFSTAPPCPLDRGGRPFAQGCAGGNRRDRAGIRNLTTEGTGNQRAQGNTEE